MTWDEHAIRTLTKMADDGYSASAIGERLGTTRNAVLGKLFRMRNASEPPLPKARRRRAAQLVAVGDWTGAGLKVAITFSPQVHEEIRAIAIRNGCSFSQAVRELVNLGLAVEAIDG